MTAKKNMKVNGKEYFRITKTIGHKYVDGKKIPIRKQFLGSSKRAAEQAYEKWKDEQNRSNGMLNDGRTFGELADYYRDNILMIDSKFAPTTRNNYKSAYDTHIRKYKSLCNKSICDVVPEDIQLVYNSMDVKAGVMGNVHNFMKAFYRWVVANRYASDALSAVVVPEKKSGEKKIIVWSDSELTRITECLADHRLRFLILLVAFTGLRISEVLGLKYADFSDDVVRVERQCCNGDLRPPKYNSVRSIPIHSVLYAELERHSEWHHAEMKRNGYKTDFLFTTNKGNKYYTADIKNMLDVFYRNNDIPQKKFHAYRATFCTNLCKAGVPIQTASTLMGHKSVEVTARFYTQISKQEQIEAINKLPSLPL